MDFGEFLQEQNWWLVPFSLAVLKIALEAGVVGLTKARFRAGIARSGVDLCFVGIALWGLALTVPHSFFYRKDLEPGVTAIAAGVVMIVLILMTILAGVVFREKQRVMMLSPLFSRRAMLGNMWLLVGTLPGLACVALGVILFQ